MKLPPYVIIILIALGWAIGWLEDRTSVAPAASSIASARALSSPE